MADKREGYSLLQTPFGYFFSWDLKVYGESLAKVFKNKQIRVSETYKALLASTPKNVSIASSC